MASSKLRRTFKYPSESDDEDAVEAGMDEQDQETLISNLSTSDTSSTRIYTLLLLVFPLAPALLSIPQLFSLSTIAPTLLSMLSFLASAYILYFLPLPPIKVEIINTSELKNSAAAGKRRGLGGYGYGFSTTGNGSQSAGSERPLGPFKGNKVAETLAQDMVLSNAGICVLLATYELWQGRTWAEGVGIGGGFLPGVVCSVIMWARRELRTMDMGELEKLKYRSKAI